MGSSLALVLGVAGPATPALAACATQGTLPGSAASTTAVGVDPTRSKPYQTIYIDDRDYLGLNGPNSGGIWFYAESNNTSNLQRGGDEVVFKTLAANGVNPTVPYVPPQQVIPPDPNRPALKNGLTLFPSGLGGGSLAQLAGEHDPCTEFGGPGQPAAPDTIIF